MFYGEDACAQPNHASGGAVSNQTETIRAKYRRKPSEAAILAKRIREIQERFPGCVIDHERIDTDNVFPHAGITYRLSDSVAAYRPRQTRNGLLYDMDRVIVVQQEGTLRFFQQDYLPIDDCEIEIRDLA